MQIITRTERRRKWTDAEKMQILMDCEEAGTSIRQVAERHDISESVIYGWRSAMRARKAEASEPQSFIRYGEIAETPSAVQIEPARVTSPAVAPQPKHAPVVQPLIAATHDVVRPHPGDRPGSIEIALTSGERLTVDSYVNEKALNRVLRALRGLP